MALRVLITRPAEDAATIADVLRARGDTVVHEPLLSIRFLERGVDLADVQAVLITSANGARALATATAIRALPVFAVGEASARTCRTLGFSQVTAAGGDVEDLARLVESHLRPATGTLLHAAGSVTAGDLGGRLHEAGFLVRKVALYGAEPATALTPATAQRIAEGAIDAALFYSPRTAATFAALVRAAGIGEGLAATSACCLSDAVRQALAGLPWRRVWVAATPTQDSLLAIYDHATSRHDTCMKEERDMTTHPPPANDGAQERPAGPEVPVLPSVAEPKPESATGETGPGETGPAETCENPREEGGTIPQTVAPPTDTEMLSERHPWRRIAAGVLLVTMMGLAGFVSLPWWRAHVPEPYRSYLPVIGPREEDRLADVHEVLATFRHDLDQMRQRLAPVNERLDQAGRALTTLEQRLTTLEQAPASLPLVDGMEGADAPSSSSSLSSLAAPLRRLAALEAALAEHAPQERLEALARQFESRLGGLGERLEVLTREQVGAATLAAVYDRLAALEEAVRHAAARQDTALAWLLAVAQLREAVHRGAPFAAELHAARALAEDAAMVDTAGSGFIAHAATGIPTRAALETRFDGLNGAIARAAVAPEGEDWFAQTVQRLLAVITIRRTDGAAAGDGALAVMARAVAAIRAGDLAGAVQTMESLHGTPAQVAESWMVLARARVAADEALSHLTAQALGRSAASRTKTGG
ncbi:MAG: uroporphyrinogen-III synthase [Rhodospirillaceae bacterium]|nr:MAG: uroporphyrinogen-III synthase [Rhodospirillaceae bacterium]